MNNHNVRLNTYDSGGYCPEFESIIENNIIYPELKSHLFDKYSVPIKLNISNEGKLYDIKSVDNKFIIELNEKYSDYRYTNDKEFETEAIRILSKTGKWIPFTYNDKYVDIEKIVFINFVYHKLYLSTKNNTLVLNPDLKPEFIGDKLVYNSIIHPTHGCEGVVTFISIVELDGSLSNVYCIGCQGKTNPEIGMSYLKRLTPWKPAEFGGKKVKSQLIITVKTQ